MAGIDGIWRAIAALSLLSGAPLAAQSLPSVSDYRIPDSPASAPATSRPQGPVDPDNPVVLRPTASPGAAPSPAPTASQPAPVQSGSPPAATSPRPSPRATIASPAAAVPSAAPLPSTAAGSTETPLEAVPEPVADASAPAQTGADWRIHSARQSSPATVPGVPLPWLAGGLAAMVLLAAVWLLRRHKARAAAEQAWEDVPEPPAEDLHTQVPEFAPTPPLRTQAPTPPQPAPHPPAPAGELALALTARRLSATLLNTSLTYEFSLTNLTQKPLGPLNVSADMISAHASLPAAEQLVMPGTDAPPRHVIAALAPGESTVVRGELRLPLAAIMPIRQGNAALFVPLARFRVAGEGVTINRAFVIGELPGQSGAGLRPFRLDLGPRNFTQIGQRELAGA